MSRFLLRHPSSTVSCVFLAALTVVAGVIHPRPIAAADDIILLPPPLVRKFPSDQFCPFPIVLQFTANASTAALHFIANVYVDDSGNLVYTHQGIDNIAVVTASDYAAHLVPNDGSYQECYLNDTVPEIFLFDQLTPGSVPKLELFGSEPMDWDYSQGASYDGTRSAHNDPSNTTGGHDQSGGSLKLGDETATPSLLDSARTSVTVSGLTANQSYVLSGWWTVVDGISTDQVSLTIKVTGPDATPLAERTWGALKVRYR